MTKPSRLPSEFLPPTSASESPLFPQRSELPSSAPSNVIWLTQYYPPAQEPPPEGFLDIDTLVEQEERNPRRRAALEVARRALAGRLPPSMVGSVASLRLRKGWSQKRLAEEMSSSQSHIARIEAGTEDVRLSTIKKLAAVLNVTVGEMVHSLCIKVRNE